MQSDVSISELSRYNFYINRASCSFIDNTNLLTDDYSGINELLKLESQNPLFEIDGEPIIIFEPYFDEQGIFYCYPLAQELKTDIELQKNFLFIMYERWLVKQPQEIFISPTQWTEGNGSLIDYSTKNIHLAVGFVPKSSVYPNDYALSEEQLPHWVQKWLDYDTCEKVQFLSALGVHTEKSDLVQLRIHLENKYESKLELGIVSRHHLLVNTLRWLSIKNVKFTSFETFSLEQIKWIYETIATEPNLPLIIVQALNDEGDTYGFVSDYQEQKYFYDQQISFSLNKHSVKLSTIFELIKARSAMLINKSLYPDRVSLESVQPVILHEVLDTELLFQAETLKGNYYTFWRNQTGEQFHIKHYLGQIPYKVLFENQLVKKIAQGDVDIDVAQNIYINSQSEFEIEKLLEKMIGRQNFTAEMLLKFIDAKNNQSKDPKNERSDDDYEETLGKIYDPLQEIETDLSENNFLDNRPDKQIELFTLELLKNLNSKLSPWKGYIYHFTHVENAANILKSHSISCRNQVNNFQDSAGKNLINRTRTDVKNFARFYFRPHTPTQFHNELLGARRSNINALCPVPIFFRFKIEDVLKLCGSKCAVSNGNLATRWARYGNSVNFLKSFDFDNVYSSIEEVGKDTFIKASQQEFIIKDQLNFKELSFDVICRNEQDKITLLSLIGKDSESASKLLIDNSYYYSNSNPSICVDSKKNSVRIGISNYSDSITGILRLVSQPGHNSVRQITSATGNLIQVCIGDELRVEGKTDMQIDFSNAIDITVYFVESGKDWLVYKNEYCSY